MRKRVNWVNILHKLDKKELTDYFFILISKKHKGKSISSNRAAYSTLKHFYSTTTIAELCEKLRYGMC